MTPRGKYQFKVMPFGLVGAPEIFQRMMNAILGYLTAYVAAYMDDVVIYSSTWQDHLQHIQQTLAQLGKAGLTVKPGKCRFGMQECPYLGHVVGRGQLKPIKAIIEVVAGFTTPKKKKDVRSFLGLAGYYRKFILGFSTIATPLTDLTRKELPDRVIWKEEQKQAYDTLKKALTTEPVLQGPNFTKQLTVHTDASDVGIGGVLSQKDETQEDRPVAFFSRKLLSWEKNYATVEKECLAIVETIKHYSVYLIGVPFTLVTDHSCLRYHNQMRDTVGRLTRWALVLQPYNYVVQHRPGSKNANPDRLPRQAWEDAPATVQEKRQGSIEDSQPGEPSTDSRLGHLMISSSES